MRMLVIAVGLLLAACGDDDGEEIDAGDDADVDAGEDAAEIDAGEDADVDAAEDAASDADPPDAPLDPTLVQLDDFQYVGAFRVPAADFNVSNRKASTSFNYSEGPIEVAPDRGSLFIVGHNHQMAVAEVTIPALVDSMTLADLNMADDPVQAFADLLGEVGDNVDELNTIGGMKYVDGELIVNAYEFYDAPADNTMTTFVARDAADLAGGEVDGFFSFAGAAHAAGWMSEIPEEFEDALGGTMITGSSSGMPIISRLSVGPSAFVFDPGDIVGDTTPGEVATTTLLDYSLDHPLDEDLSNESGANDVWTHLSRARYGFIPPGTRTYVTIGHSGGHGPDGVCYKCTPTGEDADCGGYCAVDPSDYAPYFWLYDVRDLIAVRDGAMEPYEAQPYAWGPFPVPFETTEIGGGAFDPASGLLYLTLQRADDGQGEYANPPVIVAYRLD